MRLTPLQRNQNNRRRIPIQAAFRQPVALSSNILTQPKLIEPDQRHLALRDRIPQKPGPRASAV